MPLYNPYSDLFRERIMVMGGAGMGKSFNYYSVAALARTSGSDAIFYVIDTDVSVGRMLVDPAFSSVLLADGKPTNVVFREVSDWVTVNNAVDEFQRLMRPQDWLMIDMLSPTWGMCSAYYTDQVFNTSFDKYLLTKRKEMEKTGKDGGAFDGWKDWDKINALYDALAVKLLRCPGNLYVTSEIKALSQQASKEDKLIFGPHGVSPVGKKSTPHKFSTILWANQQKANEFRLTSVKDRSRQMMAGAQINNFAIDYCVNIAGWRLGEPAAA